MILTENRPGRGGEVKKWATFAMVALLILLGTNRVIFTLAALASCCLLLLKWESGLCTEFLFFLLSMAPIFKLSGNSSSLYTYVVLLYCLIRLTKNRLILRQGEILVLLFSLYILATSFLSGTVNPKRIIKLCGNMMMICLLTDPDIEGHYRGIFLAYVVGLLLSSGMRFLDSAVFPINTYTVEVIMYEPTYSVVRFAGLYNDPNYYAVNVILALILTVVLYQRRDIPWFVVILFSVPLICFAGMTGSKSALLILCLPLGLLLIACARRRDYALLLLFLAAIAVGSWWIFSGKSALFDTTLTRLQGSGGDLTGLTSQRTWVWESYVDFLLRHPGVLLVGNSVGIYYLNGYATHNTYLDLLYQLGLVGTVLLSAILAAAYRKTNAHRRRTITNYSVLLCMLAMYFFLSQLQEFDLPFHTALCLMMMNIDLSGGAVRKRRIGSCL